LLGGKCVRCGSTDDLQVDHIEPSTKDLSLRAKHSATFWSWSWERVLAELAKCQLLCRPCHQAKSAGEVPRGVKVATAKLDEDAVRYIRQSEMSHRALGREFGVDEKVIRLVRLRKTWAHVE